MKLGHLGAVSLGTLVACHSAWALEPWALYEDFTSSALSADKWPDTGLERMRFQAGGVLRLVQRDRGATNLGDTGQTGYSWSESLSRGTSVTQLRSYVKVNAIDLTGCAGTQSTRVRARIMGTFFNTGNRATGSNVGDVLAQAYLYRDSNSVDAAGVLRVEGRIFMCTSSDCNQGTALGTVNLGTATIGQNVLLQIEWDRALNLFSFSKDQGVASGTISYFTDSLKLDDSAEPGNMFKSVGTRVDVANCASGPQTTGFIDAQFDNVFVNRTARP